MLDANCRSRTDSDQSDDSGSTNLSQFLEANLGGPNLAVQNVSLDQKQHFLCPTCFPQLILLSTLVEHTTAIWIHNWSIVSDDPESKFANSWSRIHNARRQMFYEIFWIGYLDLSSSSTATLKASSFFFILLIAGVFLGYDNVDQLGNH